MKNKFKIFLFLICTYFSSSLNLLANDFDFNTSEIKITDNGNIIDASNGEATTLDGNIKIKAELHGIWGLEASKKICKALEEFDMDWIEDPIWMDRLEDIP